MAAAVSVTAVSELTLQIDCYQKNNDDSSMSNVHVSPVTSETACYRYTLNNKTTRCIIMARVFYIHRYRYMPMHASIDACIRRAYGHAVANFRLHKKQIECETVWCRSVLTL